MPSSSFWLAVHRSMVTGPDVIAATTPVSPRSSVCTWIPSSSLLLVVLSLMVVSPPTCTTQMPPDQHIGVPPTPDGFGALLSLDVQPGMVTSPHANPTPIPTPLLSFVVQSLMVTFP